MSDAKTPVPARPAATVLLVRDGDHGLEVFMVVRHREIEFAGGALVFPGGRVEEDDKTLAGPDPLDAFRIAGIRETFEECGVLLARPKGGGPVVDATRLLGIEALHRTRVAKGEQPLSAMLAEEGLEPAADAMVHFAHWITPASRSKRFDTQFFLAAAPPDQVAVHDGHESEDSVWIRPLQAIEEANAGQRRLVFATRKVLEKLGRAATVAQALATARTARVVTVMPEMLRTEQGWRLHIPAEADYGGSVFEMLDAPAI
ncbi:NUDIX hydrolase [Paracraurococcus ruber]|uniref:NUDIX hydrolase n=1 Tax=Paracraurococcus ruber TaxID=77675 RepID=UPI001057DEE0|nr:NUDIX domain-containing protein [Paracraurococcus ruber]TDG26623.1 NUDIX hydrolase [Paracraurococcus ruber]